MAIKYISWWRPIGGTYTYFVSLSSDGSQYEYTQHEEYAHRFSSREEAEEVTVMSSYDHHAGVMIIHEPRSYGWRAMQLALLTLACVLLWALSHAG